MRPIIELTLKKLDLKGIEKAATKSETYCIFVSRTWRLHRRLLDFLKRVKFLIWEGGNAFAS